VNETYGKKITMNTIKVQVYAWISGSMGTADNQNQTLKKQLKDGATLFDLFNEIAGQYPDFSQKVFNPQNGQVSDQVMIIVNGRLVQVRDFKSTLMNDRDIVILSPVLVGG
jgi:molybdopterin converting factor small subunit